MEGDDSFSEPVQELKFDSGTNAKLGLGKGLLQNSLKQRAKNMDGGEKKSGSKKRSKVIEIGVDSSDDEPIGSLFKLKKPRNPKKSKAGLEGGGKKGQREEVREENLVDEDVDLGGMDDTLASFRKKLKGPRKDVGSGMHRGRSSGLDEPVQDDGVLDVKSTSMAVEKGPDAGDYGSGLTVDGGVENKRKGKVKRSKIDSNIKMIGVHASSEDDLECLGSQGDSLEDQKEEGIWPGEDSNHSSDEKFDDPLSSFFEKAQSGLIRKCRTNSNLKQISRGQAGDNGFRPCSESGLGVLKSVVLRRHQSDSASNPACQNPKSNDSSHLASGPSALDSTADQRKTVENQRFDGSLCQVSDCIGENHNTIQALSSVPAADESMDSSGNRHDIFSKVILEAPAPVPFPSRSHFEGIQDEPMVDPHGSNVQEGPTVDPCSSNKDCDGDVKQHIHVQVKDSCCPSQNARSETQTFKDRSRLCFVSKTSTLVHDVAEMVDSIAALKQLEKIHGFGEDESNRGFGDASGQQSKDVSTIYVPSADPEISSSLVGKETTLSCSDDDLLNKSCKITSSKKVLETSSIYLRQNSSPSHVKMDGAAKLENAFDFDQCPKGLSYSAIDSLKMEEVSSGCDGSNIYTEEPGFTSVSFQKDNVAKSDGMMSPTTETSCGVHKSGSAFQKNQQEKSLENCVHRNEFVGSIQKNISTSHENQASDDAFKRTSVPSHDYASTEGADGASPPSISPDENESYPEDAASVPNSESKDGKLSAAQRVVRIPKKRRHGDMAYEGDADWEILINEQGFLESNQVVVSDRSFRTREKFDSSSDIVTEAENGGAAAVSAGLKARAVGPVEKIKFREVLKRKGGLQEYLECRNQILGLWSKDVSRILPLAECGVTDTPSEDEPPRAFLIRDIYAFLDQSGYINFGIASTKEKAERSTQRNHELIDEKNIEENSGASCAESEEGVSFILGRVKTSEISMYAKNGVIFDDENQTMEAANRGLVTSMALEEAARGGLDTSMTLELPSVTKCEEECSADVYQQNGGIDAKLPNRLADLDVLNVDLSCKIHDSRTVPAITSELKNDLQGIQCISDCHKGGNHHLQCDSEVSQRIIVIGAGPAGLTAARHLQRQGFAVTVLEARSRIGGRVYTDRTSLSVPVDVGASIITGVEADVATERRPDPSSLVCSQLGLELTVLNSDCPLYDVLTGQKVPGDLDEALEAEFNSLLDDMVLLVAQKGEHAVKMSLEDGLEFALKRRRMARVVTDIEEIEQHNSVDAFCDSNTSSVDNMVTEKNQSKEEILSPLERRVMDWHFANLEYGCAALLKEVSLPYWNQDDVYGGFGGAHCMIKGGYSTVIESLGEGLLVHLNHVVTEVSYSSKDSGVNDIQYNKVKVSTSDGSEFSGDAVLITVPLGCLKAETIKFSPSLPQWKQSSIQRLGFGVLNKVVLEFPKVFWDDSVDYFGATGKETDRRGQCFMFWNVRKTVGAPVLIALVVGKAAIDGQNMSSSDHVNHAVMILRELFGEASVPDPVASVVTNWGRDPFSYGAYSYVAIGASGEDYDILGRPVENCVFFAGEATCKEHPDTVGGAMMSGLREAVRIIDILTTGNDYTAEVEAMEAAQRQSESERDEVRDITKRLAAVELSNVLYKNSLDRSLILTKEALLEDMFFNTKTTAGRLHLAKELLNLPVETLKSFAGTKEGLTMLNSWILDSMGKDGTQLLRHCVRILVLVSTDLLAVRSSGIGKTVKEKVCVHTSRDIRAIASQLVSVWLEVFRKEKASNGGLKLSRQATAVDSSKRKSLKDSASGKPPLRSHHGPLENKGNLQVPASAGSHLPSNANSKKLNGKMVKLETMNDSKIETNSSRSHGLTGRLDTMAEEDNNLAMSEEERAAFAAAEAARAAALAAAQAYASSEAKCNTLLQLPKIPSFHKFARREQYAQMDESDFRRKWSGGALSRQDCISEIDSRNCRVRDWSVDFSAACANLDSSRMSVDNLSQRSHSNEIACHLNFREHSGESVAVDSSIFTKAWVDTAGSVGIKDYHAIERWQSQAAAADSDFLHSTMNIKDEEDSNTSSRPPTWKHDGIANESSVSQVTVNKETLKNHPRGADRIKQAVVDYVASLLMPLYKARKIDKEGYKSIMKKSATKVMEQATDGEKAMAVSEFLDFKRRNKIRSFVDKLIERHMAVKPVVKP